MPLNFSPYKPVEKFTSTSYQKNDVMNFPDSNNVISYTINFNDDIDKILFQPRYTYLGIQAMGKEYGNFCAINKNTGEVRDKTNCARYQINLRYKDNKNNKNVINNFLSEFDKLYNSNISDNNVNYVKISKNVLNDSKTYIRNVLNSKSPDIIKPPQLPKLQNDINIMKTNDTNILKQYQPKDDIIEIKKDNLNKAKSLLLQVRNNSNTMAKNFVGPRKRQYINNINQKNIAQILKLLSNQ